MANSETRSDLSQIANEKRAADEKFEKWEGDYFEEFTDDTRLRKIGNVSFANAIALQNVENDKRNLSQKYITDGVENVYGKNQYIEGKEYHGLLSIFSDNASYNIGDGRILDDSYGLNQKLIVHVNSGETLSRVPDRNVLNFYQNLSDNLKSLQNLNPEIQYKYTDFNKLYKTTTPEWRDQYYSKNVIDSSVIRYNSEYDEENHMSGTTEGGEGFSKYRVLKRAFVDGLLKKTIDNFGSRRIKTPVAGFYTGTDIDDGEFNTGFRETYGYSHGRNLLAKEPTPVNGYTDPYCRVWTYHKQYSKVSDLIRPFSNNEDKTIGSIQKRLTRADYSKRGDDSITNGADYLTQNTVLNDNGFVNITPTVDENKNVSLKRCMFSIENLAWKGATSGLTENQVGSNGGRIMWFPPYGLSFQENVSADWSQHRILGRGENIYTYSNTTRTGQLSFILLADHPSIVNKFAKFDPSKEDDILRFFAGCSFPEIPEDNQKKEEESGSTKTGVKDEGITSNEKLNSFKFSIYFPNNFSGKNDSSWLQYLLGGRNTETKTKIEEMVGYEMFGNKISNEDYENESIKTANGKKLWYKADKNLINQKLKDKSYKDQNPETEISEQISNYRLNTTAAQGENGVSFLDFAIACMKINNETNTQLYQYLIENGGSEKSDRIKDILTESKVLNIKCMGVATEQDEINAGSLASNRSFTVEKYIKDILTKKNKSLKVEHIKPVVEPLVNMGDINTVEAKKARRVDIEVGYFMHSNNTNITDTENSIIPPVNYKVNVNLGSEQSINKDKSITTKTVTTVTVTRKEEKSTTNRNVYETEYEYFEKLKDTDPFLFKAYSDKVKYFNPAFHSMSPEGLNARMTFLQQCTRQGHTISNDEGGTAGNLAFGRMPVCVLRLGDFFYTRVIINSVSLQYDNGSAIQWDLNPEGIGAQPMFVRVSLGLTILGGQSLEGPVSRLQNAVSFDYYANTGVYDNRSTRITTDGYSTWLPNEPNKVIKDS